MTDRISSDPSRNVCRRPEDDQPEEIPRDKPAPMSKERLVSSSPIDWDKVPTMCAANGGDAARNAALAGGMSGSDKWPGAPMTSKGKEGAPMSDGAPASMKKPSSVTAGASGNAARTAERALTPYAAAGRTHDGENDFAGVALLKGRTPEGIEAEALSLSIQVGRQNEVQATYARVAYAGTHGSISAEGLTANAHVGFDNSDGSLGLNAGASATLAAAEITAKHSGFSVTAGAAAGVGGEVHVGVRDDDKDNNPEFCVRVAASFLIGGACVEFPLVIKP